MSNASNAVQYVLSKGSVIVITDSEEKVYPSNSDDYAAIKKFILDGNENGLVEYVNSLKKVIEKYFEGFTVENDVVFVDGEALPDLLGKRVKAFADEGADYKYLLRFWENLKKNPSYRSVNTLFNFLSNTHCPIDKNGFIQCYKAVKGNFTDKHTGKIDNSPGQTVKMERRLISDDPKTACHVGLHAGSVDYVLGFANGYDDKILEVLVNPAHVVCVPEDSSFGKMRVEEYTVVREVSREELTGDLPLKQTYGDEEEEDDECPYGNECGTCDCDYDYDEEDEEWDLDDEDEEDDWGDEDDNNWGDDDEGW